MTNINNDSHLTDGETQLKARADFMGQGNLQIHTVFPWERGKDCRMTGSLKNFDFEKINAMLKPATPIEIKTGTLDDLDFAFVYNDSRSLGELTLKYHDLKVVYNKPAEEAGKRKHGKKNPEDDKKDNLKTFLINTFLIKKNMDGNIPDERGTGTISFSRNKTRSIFNYWWKSLFTGIQSAFHLDKLKAKSDKKTNANK
jgi:hypothetical protein